MTKWILLVYLIPLWRESYVVTYVQGTVVVKRGNTQDTLHSRSKIFENDSVRFLSSPALVRVACSQGTFYMKENGQIQAVSYSRSNSFWKNVKSNLLPTERTGEMKSRGLIGNVYEATPYFKQFGDEPNAMTLLGSRRVEVSRTGFADTANKFFYLTWEYQGEVINKKIPWEKKDGKLYMLFDDNLFKVDNRPVGMQMLQGKLSFFDKKESSSIEISPLAVRKFTTDDVDDELCLVIQEITGGKPGGQLTAAQKEKIGDYIFSRLGNVDNLMIDDKFIDKIKCKQ